MEKTREELIALINDCDNEHILEVLLSMLKKYHDIGAI